MRKVGLSTAQSASRTPSAPAQAAESREEPAGKSAPAGPPAASTAPKAANGRPLSASELQLIRQLSARDREVRAHEQAHLGAAGGYATGGPSFTYQTGPDGVRYAIGGEVGIDTSPVPGNPRATLAKAHAIIAAANAPAEPSGQDRAVAAAAAQMAAWAQAEVTQSVVSAAYAAREDAHTSLVQYG